MFSPQNATSEKDGCTDCPKNKYRDDILLACAPTECGNGTAESAAGATYPTRFCQQKISCSIQNSVLDSEDACVCAPNFYNNTKCDECLRTGTCKPCPKGAKCESKDTSVSDMVLEPGYWRTHPSSFEVRECPNKDVCNGTACKDGYDGHFCMVCAEGWAHSSSGCEQCSSKGMGGIVTLLVLLSIAAACLAMWCGCKYLSKHPCVAAETEEPALEKGHQSTLSKNLHAVGASTKNFLHSAHDGVQKLKAAADGAREVAEEHLPSLEKGLAFIHDKAHVDKDASAGPKFKIVVSFTQVINEIKSVYSIPYPANLAEFFSNLNFINFDVLTIAGLGCVSPFSFYNKLFMMTLTPLALAGVLWGAYRSTDDSKTKSKYVGWFLKLTFFVFPGVSTVVLQTFPCYSFDDVPEPTRFLKADLSINCNAPNRGGFVAWGVMMTLVYPIGITVMYSVLLWKHRMDICPIKEDLYKCEEDKDSGKLAFVLYKSKEDRGSDTCQWRDLSVFGCCLIKDVFPRNLGNDKEEQYLIDTRNKNMAECEQKQRNSTDKVEVLSPPPTAPEAGDTSQLAPEVEDTSSDLDFTSIKFLFKEYEPYYWWFEIFECARRLMLTGGSVMFMEGTATQVVCGILIALLSIHVYSMCQPFIHDEDDMLALAAQWGIFFTLFFGLLLKLQLNKTDDYDQDGSGFGVLLMIVNIMVMLLGFCMLVYGLWHSDFAELGKSIKTP